MYVPVELYFNSKFCVSANPMRIMLGIMMKKAKNQNRQTNQQMSEEIKCLDLKQGRKNSTLWIS